MKLRFYLFYILIILSANLFAGLPHNVYVEVYFQNGQHPQSITFDAWIIGRESEVIHETSGGCGHISNEGLLFVQTGSFPTSWSIGDTLRIYVQSGYISGLGDFVLSSNGGDFHGPTHFNNGGIMLLGSRNFNIFSDKIDAKVNEVIHFKAPKIKNAVAWKWDFNNDGKIDSIEKNPSYKYKTAGKYSVRLELTFKDSSQKILVKKVDIMIR